LLVKVIFQNAADVGCRRLAVAALLAFRRSVLFRGLLRKRRPEAASAEHHDAAHAIRMRQREIDGHGARLRMADERRAVESERVHETQNERGAEAQPPFRRIVAQAEAGLIIGNHAQAIRRERREIAAPDVRRGAQRGAMDQQRRRSPSVLDIAYAQPIDGGEFILMLGYCVHSLSATITLPALPWRRSPRSPL